MSYINIVIYVLLGLSVLIGFIRGFKMKRIHTFLFLVAGFCGYMVGLPLARGLMDTALGSSLLQNAYLSILPESPLMASAYDSSFVKDALTEVGIPNFFQGIFSGKIVDGTSSMANAIASSFANVTITYACVLLIFFIVFFVLRFALKPFWDGLFGEEGKSFLGRVFGIVIQAAKTTFSVLVLLAVLSLINEFLVKASITGLNDFLVKDLALDNPEAFSIGKFFYNTSSALLTWISTL
ncbi:MAG: hypothetical protein SPI99_02310 [Candidatus Enterosoma sp.]|nr:hypothetical protein [Candidatus Enterosoma sp.]